MDGSTRPAFEQSNGPPTSQPYPMPQRSPTSQDGPPPNHYPQYSYDIQMRYSDDPNRQYGQHDPERPYSQDASRPYPPDPSGQQPQDIPRQYAQAPNPYAKELPSHYPPPPPPNHYPPPPHSPHGPGVQLPSLSMSMQGPNPGYGVPQEMAMDTTGQIAPAGMKPRVTATLWEDEGTLCFQVDVKGTCVARREDNHMVNGTKLLNVAGMTRGRRDGILKAEKQKHVVKIGPMHLKGVWIPYERALTFANKENITPLLYPIFVHNIGALLYHPVNHARGYPATPLPRRGDEHNPQGHNGLPPPPQSPYSPGHFPGSGQPQHLGPKHEYPPPPTGHGEAVLFNSARVHEPQQQHMEQ